VSTFNDAQYTRYCTVSCEPSCSTPQSTTAVHVRYVALTRLSALLAISAISNNIKLVHWPLMGGLLHLVQRGGDWAWPQPAQAPPRCTKCTHQRPMYQSTSVNVPVKGYLISLRTTATAIPLLNKVKYTLNKCSHIQEAQLSQRYRAMLRFRMFFNVHIKNSF